jgi:hypothetical protein
MPVVLAQSSQSVPVGSILMWVAVLVAAIMVGGLGIMLLRRRVLSRDEGLAASEGLLDSLRRLRDNGEISVDEYNAARKAMASKLAGSAGLGRPGRPPRGRVVPERTESEGKGDGSTDN